MFLSDAVVPTSGSEWWHIKLDVDLAANSGLGEATLYAEKAGSGTGLQPVAGLTDVNLNLDDDAATWDGLSVDLQWGAGIDNIKIDNIKITAVPEPSSAAVMAGLAGLGLALLRRRR